MFFLVNLPLWRQALRGLGAVLCNVIYNLISWIYQLFMVVAQLNILSEGTTHEIYQRVTMILTIVMTFYITFEFVKYTINPDTFTDKDKGVGNILQRMVIVVVLIAFVPEIFSLAYQGQSAIIKNQVFSKIILGKKDINTEKFGGDFSANILGLFYELDEECTNGNNCQEASDAVTTNLNNLRENGSVNILDKINTPSETGGSSLSFDGTPAIHFNGILAIIVGGFIVYMLVLYSIDVGVRYAQLIFLQLIAPIAIMGYLLPKKDGIFQKWTKQCITTYIDLFIRIAIIYFVILLIQTLGSPETGEIFASLDGVSKTLRIFAYVVLVMGLLIFAQRAPKLLGELLPGGGAAGIGFGLAGKGRFEPIKNMFNGARKTVSGTANTAGRVVGGVGGALAGAAAGKRLGGRLRGAAIGAKEGSKKDAKGLPHRRIERAYEASAQQRQKEEEVLRNSPDITATGGIGRKIQEERAVNQAAYHRERWANKAAEYERKSKLFDIAGGSLDAINKQVDEFKQIKAIKAELESAKSRGASAAEIKTIDAKYKRACQEVRRAIVANNGVISEDMIRNGIKVQYNQMDDNGFPAYEYVEQKDAHGNVVLGSDGKPKMVVKRDANGNPVEAPKIDLDIRFDSGDRNFSYTLNQTAKNELAKMKAAAGELDYIAKAEVTLKVNGVDTKKTIGEWINDPNILNYYAEFTNKFKDAMVEQKTRYENEDDYVRAQAYKNGIGDSGGKK